MAIEVIISDTNEGFIDRQETIEKLNRLDYYMTRVKKRYAQIKVQEKALLPKKKDADLIEEGLSLYGLRNKIKRTQ